uniref:Uncharacterized protein n=1 Tax=Anguilla anguilla TaxID=7936 RepID=A0A0E9Q6L6_ANGAN
MRRLIFTRDKKARRENKLAEGNISIKQSSISGMLNNSPPQRYTSAPCFPK